LSAITIASSTTMPSTTIKAEIDTCCSSTPRAFKPAKVIETVTGIVIAATNATRNGNSSIVTRMTAAIAIPNSRKKSRMRCETTRGWSATRSSFTSGGSELWTSASFLRKASPAPTMLSPS
jgi:hypothetical protein